MKKAAFYIVFFFHALHTIAQTDVQRAELLYKEANVLFEKVYEDENVYKEALNKYQKAKQLLESAKVQNETYATTLLKIGSLYEVSEDYSRSIRYYKASIDVWKNLTSNTDGLLNTFISLGNIFSKTESYDSALYYCNKAESLIPYLSKTTQKQRLYNITGVLLYKNGDYKQSISYLEKAFILAQQSKVPATELCIFQLNIASAANSLGQYSRALQAYKQALKYNYVPEIVNRKIGETYLKLNKQDSALLYLQKAAIPDNPENRIVVWNHLGNLYTQRGEYARALDYYNQSIALNRKQLGNKNTKLATSYVGIGQVYEAQKQFPKALATYQQALHLLHFSFQDAGIYKNPTDLDNVVSRLDFFKVLRAKAAALQKYYLQTGKNPDLEASLQTYQLAIRLAEQLRLSYDSDEAKLFFNQQVFPVYEEAVTAAFTLFEKANRNSYAELAFVLSEKSKAAVLAETLRGLQIGKQKGVPAGLLKQEKELRRKITKLTVASIETKDSAQMVALKDQIRDNEIALSQLVKKLDANEKYYQLKYNHQPISVVQLQKRVIDRNTALVEYFFGDKALYAFVITPNGLRGFRLSADTIFHQALQLYKNSLFEHHNSPQQPVWSNRLYQTLVAPLQSEIRGYDKLIIVPDGELSYLPFESLVQDPNRLSYLLDAYVIRYAYSGTLLEFAQRKHNELETKEVMAMAPFAGKAGSAFRSMQISPLPASKTEVEQIGGRIFLESAATKEVFLKMASRYGIVHLATHAKADSDDPLNSYITFYPKDADSVSGYRLYTSELYNLQLDSVKLVVLSACETGGGQLVRGEGVMSLARAFAYAGCPNIAMTLWRAEDQATAQITTRMYEYLKQGYDKDEALTKSKQDYLQEAPAARRNPYYWANVVLVGDADPVYSSYRWYWIGGLVLFLLLLASGLWVWRNQKTKQLKSTVAGK